MKSCYQKRVPPEPEILRKSSHLPPKKRNLTRHGTGRKAGKTTPGTADRERRTVRRGLPRLREGNIPRAATGKPEGPTIPHQPRHGPLLAPHEVPAFPPLPPKLRPQSQLVPPIFPLSSRPDAQSPDSQSSEACTGKLALLSIAQLCALPEPFSAPSRPSPTGSRPGFHSPTRTGSPSQNRTRSAATPSSGGSARAVHSQNRTSSTRPIPLPPRLSPSDGHPSFPHEKRADMRSCQPVSMRIAGCCRPSRGCRRAFRPSG